MSRLADKLAGRPQHMGKLASMLAAQGRGGDTMLAHINRAEAELLNRVTDGGSINPRTGLPEYASPYLDLGGAGESGLTGLGAGAASLGSPAGISGMVGAGVGSAIGSLGGPLGSAVGAGIGGSFAGMGNGQAWGTGIGSAIGGIFGPIGSMLGGAIGGKIGGQWDAQDDGWMATGPAPGEVEANDAFGGGGWGGGDGNSGNWSAGGSDSWGEGGGGSWA